LPLIDEFCIFCVDLSMSCGNGNGNGNNGNNGNGNGNSGNNGNQSAIVVVADSSFYPLHQGNGKDAIDWKGYLQGSDFGLSEKKGETALVPGYDEYGTEGVLWHFVNPDKLGGYAIIYFYDGAGNVQTVKIEKSYKNDQHFAVVTPQDWKIFAAEYYPATAPKKGATQFNLSHTAATIVKAIPTGSLTVNAEADLTITTKTKYQIRQKEFTYLETWSQYVSESYDSVTAMAQSDFDTNKKAFIVANSNHFAYAKLSKDALLDNDGVALALVVGNGLNLVGNGLAKIENGKLVLDFSTYGEVKFGALAFTNIPKPGNGNIHSDNAFKHNNVAVLEVPEADANGFIYLYLHFKTVRFDGGMALDVRELDEQDYKVGTKIKTSVADPVDLAVTVVVSDSNGNEIPEANWAKLAPGFYRVVCTAEGYDIPFFDESVEVKSGGSTELSFSENYEEIVKVYGGVKYRKDIWNEAEIIKINIVTVK